MQVTATNTEGLRREFKIVVPASELDTRLTERLAALKDDVRIRGFRPGKVPLSHLKRLFGRSTMAEVVQAMLSEVARQTLDERGEKAAMQPDYQLPEQEETEKVLSGAADLAYTMIYEVLPKFDLGDFQTIAVERPVVEPSDAEVETELKRLASETRTFAVKDGAAAKGDRVTLSYVGKIDDVPFQGGSDDNATITIGDGRFISGFEEALIGLKAGDEKTFPITFPADYGNKTLAGKQASFTVKIKSVAAGDEVAIDDQLAVRVGVESLAELRDTIKRQLQLQLAQLIRQRIKRQLLDRLDEMHKIDLPPGLVEQEFDSIWRQIVQQLNESGRTFADENTTEEAAREEYQKIAARRVRLGLVMSEIGDRNQITVTDEEVQRALAAQMRQFPGREQTVLEYYRNNPEAVATLRAPIFEEKVVDYLLELVRVTDKPMTREALVALDQEEDTLV
jgi:trigger factor